MAIRTINYSVSSDGISPNTEQRAGLQSEHAVTQLVFTLDNTLYQALLDEKQDGDTLVYRFDCIDSTGGTVRTESTELTDSVITFTVGENLTRNGGKARVYLVISRYNAEEETEIEMLSFPARLRFENVPASDNGNSRESLSTLAEAAKNAAARAEQSADTAVEAVAPIKNDLTDLAEYAKTEVKGNLHHYYFGDGANKPIILANSENTFVCHIENGGTYIISIQGDRKIIGFANEEFETEGTLLLSFILDEFTYTFTNEADYKYMYVNTGRNDSDCVVYVKSNLVLKDSIDELKSIIDTIPCSQNIYSCSFYTSGNRKYINYTFIFKFRLHYRVYFLRVLV